MVKASNRNIKPPQHLTTPQRLTTKKPARKHQQKQKKNTNE